MRTNLIVDTDQYQVYDLGYGLCLLNKTPIEENNTEVFKNVLFQGDDAIDFQKEIDNIEKADLKESYINYLFSQYETVMNSSLDNNYLNTLGMNVTPPKLK